MSLLLVFFGHPCFVPPFSHIHPTAHGQVEHEAVNLSRFQGNPQGDKVVILWMGKILRHFDTMGNHDLLVFTGGIIIPGSLRWGEMNFVHPQ